jgi:hypothetical protein
MLSSLSSADRRELLCVKKLGHGDASARSADWACASGHAISWPSLSLRGIAISAQSRCFACVRLPSMYALAARFLLDILLHTSHTGGTGGGEEDLFIFQDHGRGHRVFGMHSLM